MSEFTKAGLIVSSIVSISVIAYLPAVHNSFISDDFGLFPMIEALERDPLYILQATSELFRLMSYVYFWGCFMFFGLSPEPYYWAGIALHAIVSLLVYSLVLTITGRSLAAWAGAAFFAAYERHQEAVMWISAANELILALNCLLFLLIWERTSSTGMTRTKLLAALVVFLLALFSKEAAVVLAPMVIVSLVLRGYSPRGALLKSLPIWVVLAVFVTFWLLHAHQNFFVTEGYYAFTLNFIPVYTRSLVRLLSQAIPFAIAMFVIRHRHAQTVKTNETAHATSVSHLPWNSSVVFFVALLVLAIAPYSFLTYLDHIPSRHSYLPSVGLAGLVGILFAALYDRMASVRSKCICILSLSLIVTANVAYIWLKKEPQYRERAAPTRELIAILNGQEIRDTSRFPIYVSGFPLHPSVFSETVARFTPFNTNDVVFLDNWNNPADAAILRWDPASGRYIANWDTHGDAPKGGDSVVDRR